ncbi:ABC transporter permease [Dermacoccaceae bacterium W4C1]
MNHAIKAEFRKMLSTRMWWGMAIGVFLSGALIAFLFGATTETDGGAGLDAEGNPITFTPTEIAINTYTGGVTFGYLFLLVIGIMTMGAEYRHKTITSSLLAVPRRTQLVLAKVVALLGFGIMYGLIFLLGSVAAGGVTLSARGFEVFPEPGTVLRSLALVLLVLGLWALIGLGLGVLIPNQVAAILVGVSVAFIIEPIAAAVLSSQDWGESVSKFMPSRATSAILGAYSGDSGDQLSWWAGSLVLLAYAVVAAGVGLLLTKRRDVS